ncbi:unnamed protein product [Nyctereutes procyonoides]|uniref:(raccoon dog) hypothetical protein n=1 Tax=Nyctereutes procyonoides TaxID=34880 RepID=A0A811ZWM0_NYCPR|nr:unnamed protein product [Nyctereutes procyonoides]
MQRGLQILVDVLFFDSECTGGSSYSSFLFFSFLFFSFPFSFFPFLFFFSFLFSFLFEKESWGEGQRENLKETSLGLYHYKLPSWNCFCCVPEILNHVFLFSFVSMYFFVSSLIHWLFSSILFSLHTFVFFPVFSCS